ncbi:MAG: transposase [Chitinivibrionales bacterium]|nr:transposase [Chitinivibrionales bacterium]
MPRAKRFFLPGFIYHITHRCHNRQYLLKYAYEKRRWMTWLSASIEKYDLSVLGYCVTDNHIHLLAHPGTSQTVIAQSMQLTAGRVGQEYNERKGRKGAFWEDRYHATAIQSHHHLLRCLVYVDLNMVRAKVVEHPGQWQFCGFAEMGKSSDEACLVDRSALLQSLGKSDWNRFVARYNNEIEMALDADELYRSEIWTKSIAVGDREYVEQIKENLNKKAHRRKVNKISEDSGELEEVCALQESTPQYGSTHSSEIITGDNTILWDKNAW